LRFKQIYFDSSVKLFSDLYSARVKKVQYKTLDIVSLTQRVANIHKV